MKVTIKHSNGTWIVLQEGQSTQVFATLDGAMCYVSGISCGLLLEVTVYDEYGSVILHKMLNAAVQ